MTLAIVRSYAAEDVPLLDTDKPTRAEASSAEIQTALESLSTASLLRLRAFARYRMRAIGAKALGRTDEDLLGEAYTATLAGTRKWNRAAVDIVGHLCGVMRSLSSHWAAHKVDEDLCFASDPGSPLDPIDRHPTAIPDAEREVEAREEVARIRDYFSGDSLVTGVIESFRKGLKGPEVQSALGISPKEFESAVKRLRRGVERLERIGEGYV